MVIAIFCLAINMMMVSGFIFSVKALAKDGPDLGEDEQGSIPATETGGQRCGAALPTLHIPLNLVLDSVALLLVVVLSDLFVLGGTLLLVLCVALFFGYTVALLSGNILAVLLGYILALLLGHLVAHLLGLAVTLSGWHHRSYGLLDILALGNWHWTTDRLENLRAFLLIFIVCVRNLVALFSRLIPTFLTWLIPALLLAIFHNTFSLSNSSALPLGNSSANILMSKRTLSFSSLLTNLLPDRGALLLSNSLALLFILVLGNFLLDSLALHVWCIMALFHLLQITLIFSY